MTRMQRVAVAAALAFAAVPGFGAGQRPGPDPGDAPETRPATRPVEDATTRPALSFDVEEAPAPKPQTVIVDTHQGLKNHRAAWAVRNIHGQRPEAKVRLTVFGLDPDSDGMRFGRLVSAVALDANGRPHGMEFFDRRRGQWAKRLVPYVHGVRHGVEEIHQRHGRSTYVQTAIPWKHGERTGVQKTFYPDGGVQTETTLVDGVAEGPMRSYTAEGELAAEGRMLAGRRHGMFVEYWPGTDRPRRKIPYDHGKIDGTVRAFYSTGRLKRVLPFVANTLHGRETQYGPGGQTVRVRVWKDGELLTETQPATQPATRASGASR